MSNANFSTDLFVLVINGRTITDFGETATPFTDAPIDAKTTLRRGIGGRAVRMDRKNPGRSVSIFLNPGSSDSAYVQGLMNANANIEMSTYQIGTLESSIGIEGVIVNDASNGRAGTSITDDQYDFEFNGWNATKGG